MPKPIHPSALRRAQAAALLAALFLQASRGQTAPTAPAAALPVADAPASWSLHGQATWIDQGHPSFNSPYEGPNSLEGNSENERTFSMSIFMGRP